MKVRVVKEVPLSQVFGHALAAWDYGVYEWYRGVRYTARGGALALSEREVRDIEPGTLLCTLTMYDPNDNEPFHKRIKVRITPNKLRKALEQCLRKGGHYSTEAMKIIEDSPACDMNTADTLMQVLAYGECVFG